MTNINNDNKLHELGLYVNMNLNSINISKQQNVNIDNNKNDNNSSNTITRIKRKASTMNYKQRELQERISNIQTQETKIYEMEKALESVKYSYSEKLKNEKKEFFKVKINQLSKQEDDLELKSNTDLKNKTRDKQHEDERVISVIEETLKKIEQIKNQISIYKSKLMDLEDSVDKAISKLSSSKNFIDKDFVIEELGFISIEDNIETGIIININI